MQTRTGPIVTITRRPRGGAPATREENALSDILSRPEQSQQRDRPPIPRNRALAVVSLPWFEQRTVDAYRTYEAARRELHVCRGELAVVQDIAKGEYDEDEPTHAVEAERELAGAMA